MTIRISQRVGALPGYPLGEIPSIKRRLLEAGVDVIDLGAGDNDTPPPAVVVDALREALGVYTSKALSPGHQPAGP